MTGPIEYHYDRREKIPEEHRCKQCDGLGIYRWRHSCFVTDEGDWKECWSCNGSGIKTVRF